MMTPGTLLSGVPRGQRKWAELEIEEHGFTFEMCSVGPVGVKWRWLFFGWTCRSELRDGLGRQSW